MKEEAHLKFLEEEKQKQEAEEEAHQKALGAKKLKLHINKHGAERVKA